MAEGRIGPSMPTPQNPGGENELPPVEQRTPKGAPLGKGPKVGEKGEYLPATYKTAKGNVRTDR